MVQLVLSADFKHQVLQWNVVTVPIKQPSRILGQTYVTSREMRKVVIQTAEPASTREATERLVKILASNYAKADLKQASDNATQLNADERNQSLSLLGDFEGLFDGTLGDCDTYPVDL